MHEVAERQFHAFVMRSDPAVTVTGKRAATFRASFLYNKRCALSWCRLHVTPELSLLAIAMACKIPRPHLTLATIAVMRDVHNTQAIALQSATLSTRLRSTPAHKRSRRATRVHFCAIYSVKCSVEFWASMRTLITSLVAEPASRRLGRQMHRSAQDVCRHVSGPAESGVPVDIEQPAARYVFELLFQIVFGASAPKISVRFVLRSYG